MLRPSKAEIAAVSARLQDGADSPDDLAHDVIQLVERLRGEREQWFTVFELSPGIYQGYGPYPTRAMALKQTPKFPMAQIAKRGAVIPMLGPAQAEKDLATADEPPAERGDFAIAREDAACFARGWKGNQRDRNKFLTPTT